MEGESSQKINWNNFSLNIWFIYINAENGVNKVNSIQNKLALKCLNISLCFMFYVASGDHKVNFIKKSTEIKFFFLFFHLCLHAKNGVNKVNSIKKSISIKMFKYFIYVLCSKWTP